MSSFAEVRLDDSLIIYHTIGGPVASTSIVTTDSGREYRNANWSTNLGRWDLGERSMVPADLEVMQNFFNARQARFQGFRFRDWADYKDRGNGVLLPIAGSTTTVQMFKNYPSGGTTGSRKISKPVAGTISIYNNGVLDSGAVIDTTTGIVTPSSMTGTLTWTGEFDKPVRFDADQMQFEFIAARGTGGAEGVTDAYFHLHTLPIVELRL